MEQRDYMMREIDALGKMLGAMIAFLLGLKNGAVSTRGIEVVNQTFRSEADLDLDMLLSIDPDNLIDYLTTNNKGFNEDNLDKLADLLFTIANDMGIGNPKRIPYYKRCLVIYEYLNSVQKIYSFDRHLKLEQIKDLNG